MSVPIPEAAAPTPVTDVQPKPTPPATPAVEEFKYPTDTPLSGMDASQQAEYWREKAQHHEKAWRGKAGDVTPEQVKELRDKAKRFDEFEESQKTEMQKVADKATKAEADAATSRGELAVMRAAVKHGLEEGDLDLLGTHGTPEEIDARAEKLAARIKASEADKPKPDFGGGDRGGDVTGKPQFDTQIAEATKAGDFARVIALKEAQHASTTSKS